VRTAIAHRQRISAQAAHQRANTMSDLKAMFAARKAQRGGPSAAPVRHQNGMLHGGHCVADIAGRSRCHRRTAPATLFETALQMLHDVNAGSIGQQVPLHMQQYRSAHVQIADMPKSDVLSSMCLQTREQLRALRAQKAAAAAAAPKEKLRPAAEAAPAAAPRPKSMGSPPPPDNRMPPPPPRPPGVRVRLLFRFEPNC